MTEPAPPPPEPPAPDPLPQPAEVPESESESEPETAAAQETPPEPPVPALPPESEPTPDAACRSCGGALMGAFCHACGEKRIDGPLRLKEIARETFDSALELERGFPRTFVGLLRAPGATVREYLIMILVVSPCGCAVSLFAFFG